MLHCQWIRFVHFIEILREFARADRWRILCYKQSDDINTEHWRNSREHRYSSQKCAKTLQECPAIKIKTKCHRQRKKNFTESEHILKAKLTQFRLSQSAAHRHLNDTKHEQLRNNTGTEALYPPHALHINGNFFCVSHTNTHTRPMRKKRPNFVSLLTFVQTGPFSDEALQFCFKLSESDQQLLALRTAHAAQQRYQTHWRCQGNRPTSANHNPSPSTSPGNCCSPR